MKIAKAGMNIEHSRDSLERMIGDYNQLFATNFSTDTFSNYFADVSKKVKTAQIDILLVVNMFLTGFDSKTLNTLYVDKNLTYHDLLQAFSRTNRVEKSTKPYGNIVCYRNLKKQTDEAICLFSQTHSTDTVLMQSYEHYLKLFKVQVEKLFHMALTPNDVDLLESEEDKKQFIIVFRELSKLLLKLQSFTEFEFDENMLGMSEQKYQDFKSKYFLLYDETKIANGEKVSILSDIDFAIELMHTDKINVNYIMNLIRNIDLGNKEKREKDIQHIITELERADSEELRLKVDLLKAFLEKVVPHLEPEDSIDDAYMEFEDVQRKEEVNQFASEIGMETKMIKEHISEYEYARVINQELLSDSIKASTNATFLKRIEITKQVKEFITTHVVRYE